MFPIGSKYNHSTILVTDSFIIMYYPGLFETTSPFSGLNARSQFKPDSLSSVEHTELCSLVDKKNMVSNLSTSLANSSLSLSSNFRAVFPAPHYRSQASTVDLMTSPYIPSSATHLSSDNLSSNLLHDQTFLDASSPYNISALSSYSHYPPYLSNSVINSALKAPNGSTYPSHNSFYPSNAPPYHSLYTDSFISDYITRSHIEESKSAYNSSSDNASFFEHLKRLQESFQSKSPKFSENQSSLSQYSNQLSNSLKCANKTNTSTNRPLRPEPISRPASGSKSPVIFSSHHYSNVDTSFSLTTPNNVVASNVTDSSATFRSTTIQESFNKTVCNFSDLSVTPWNAHNLSKSKSPQVSNQVSKQQLFDSHPANHRKLSVEPYSTSSLILDSSVKQIENESSLSNNETNSDPKKVNKSSVHGKVSWSCKLFTYVWTTITCAM